MKKPKPTEASDRAWCPVYGSMFEDVDMTEDTTYDADQGWAEENARKYKQLLMETEAYFKRKYTRPPPPAGGYNQKKRWSLLFSLEPPLRALLEIF